jgi:hypothetical protein
MPKNKKWPLTILILASVLLTVIGSEIVLRAISHTDIDGNVFVVDRRIRPFQFPIKNLEKKLEQYKKIGTSYTHYDPHLGWAVRPNSRSEHGLYFSNSKGVRTSSSRRETLPEAAPGMLRIAIFGDSFTHGDDVSYEESWGAILEDILNQNGLRAEVLNLGGLGYAMDQAFLRWRKHGKPLNPDLVLFGFQNSNIKRNMNLIRMFYSPDSGIIFTKPRFILKDDALQLINSPTVPPQDLINVFNNWQEWELREHEFFFQESNYSPHPLYKSRLASFVITGLTTKFSSRRKDYDFFATHSSSGKLALGIIETFKREVEQEGGSFFIVHIPTKNPLKILMEGDPLKYHDLLEMVRVTYDLLDPAPALIDQARIHGLNALLASGSSHYSKIANEAVAQTVATALLSR